MPRRAEPPSGAHRKVVNTGRVRVAPPWSAGRAFASLWTSSRSRRRPAGAKPSRPAKGAVPAHAPRPRKSQQAHPRGQPPPTAPPTARLTPYTHLHAESIARPFGAPPCASPPRTPNLIYLPARPLRSSGGAQDAVSDGASDADAVATQWRAIDAQVRVTRVLTWVLCGALAMGRSPPLPTLPRHDRPFV